MDRIKYIVIISFLILNIIISRNIMETFGNDLGAKTSKKGQIYEYMCVGKPVISTKLKGIMNEFGNDSGIIYINSINELFKTADELTKNDGLRESCGKKAFSFVQDQNWDKIIEIFENYLNTLLQMR